MAGCRSQSDGRWNQGYPGNPVITNAYKEGIPGNGKPPAGSMIVKDRVIQKKEPCVPLFWGGAGHPKIGFFDREGFQEIPGHEWMGISQLLHDAASDTFKHFGSDSSFGKRICYQCHTLVTAEDFLFTISFHELRPKVNG
jgi:hypothetical protein